MVSVKRPRLGASSLIPNQNLKRVSCGLSGEDPPLVGLGLPAADRSRRGGRSAKQPLEERRAGREAPAIAGEAHARRQGGRRTAVARLGMRNHVFQVPVMLPFEERGHGGVAAVDILSDLHLAGVVHKGGLVGGVERDRGGKL